MAEQPKFATRWFFSGLGDFEQKGLFGSKIRESQRWIDFDDYAKRLAAVYTDLDDSGYDVVNVVPIAMGQSEPCAQIAGTYVGDVGFSITRGAVVIGRRRA